MVFKDLRGKASDWFVKFLLILIIASFALWGVPEFLRGYSSGTTVAKVGDVEISKNYLHKRMQTILQRFKGEITMAQAVQMGLHKRILESMITEILIDLEIRDLKLTSSDQSLLFQVRHDATFQDESGRFSSEKLNALLKSAGLSEKQFLSQLRNNLLQQQLAVAISAQTYLPAQLAIQLMEAMGQKRDIDVFFIALKDVAEKGTPAQEDLEAFYNENKERFEQPEFRRATIISITPDALFADSAISEAQLQNAYDTNKNLFTKPEAREVLVASINDLKEIEAVKQAIAYKNYAKYFHNFGYVSQGELAAEIDAAAFGLKAGELSDVIKTSEGNRVVLVKSVRPAKTRSLNAVKKKVLRIAKKQFAQEKMIALANEIDDKIASGATLEDIAKEHDFTLTRTNLIDRAGTSKEGDKNPTNIEEEVVKTIFGQEEKVDGTFQETKDGTTYLVRVDEVYPMVIPPLEEIREEISQAWQVVETQKKADALAAHIVTELDKGTSAKDIMRQQKNVTQKTFRGITRAELAEKTTLSTDLISNIYKTSAKKALAGQSDAHAVVAITREIINAKNVGQSKEMGELKKIVATSLAQELETTFVAALREKFGVKINDENLNQLAE